jgi:hypothetical protein
VALLVLLRAVLCAGFGMGLMFGMFLGAMGDMQPIQLVNGREIPQPPLGEQVMVCIMLHAGSTLSLR